LYDIRYIHNGQKQRIIVRERKYIYIIALLLVSSIFTSSGCAYAFWIWTPQSKKWVNPKNEPRSVPKEQFEWAMSFYNKAKYKKARSEFKKLIKKYSSSKFASEAQYHIGLCYQAEEEYYQAFLAYQKLIESYPYSERIDDIVKRQYEIGKIFHGGYKSKLLGWAILPSTDRAIEVFQKVAENAPYSPYADKALYHLGLNYKKMLKYQEAKETFEKITEQYPESELVDDARFQIGLCSAEASKEAVYDQVKTEESIEEFEDFIKVHPESEKTKEAEVLVDELRSKKAESIFVAARFYEKRKKYESATIYYNQLLKDYADTAWAPKALERLEVLKQKGKIE